MTRWTDEGLHNVTDPTPDQAGQLPQLPMVGLFSLLSPEQKAKAQNVTQDESFGPYEFRRELPPYAEHYEGNTDGRPGFVFVVCFAVAVCIVLGWLVVDRVWHSTVTPYNSEERP